MRRAQTALSCCRLLLGHQTMPQMQVASSFTLGHHQLHTLSLLTAASAGIQQQLQQAVQPQLSSVIQQLPSSLRFKGPERQLQPCCSAAVLYNSHRSYCEGDLRVIHAEVSEDEYHHLADELLDTLQEKLEVFVEDMDLDGGDVEHAQGVLTVKLGSHGTYVINKQTPNRQIWLSSPVSGPFRYDYHQGKWVYNRDGRELLSQLQQELQQLLGSAPALAD